MNGKLVFPVEMQVLANFQDQYLNVPQETLESFCKEKNITFINLLAFLSNYKNKELFMDQCHYTPGGLELVAERIKEAIKINSY